MDWWRMWTIRKVLGTKRETREKEREGKERIGKEWRCVGVTPDAA